MDTVNHIHSLGKGEARVQKKLEIKTNSLWSPVNVTMGGFAIQQRGFKFKAVQICFVLFCFLLYYVT